jgi:CRP-like cAMP-binding protein
MVKSNDTGSTGPIPSPPPYPEGENLQPDHDRLRAIPLFRELSDEDLDKLAPWLTAEEVSDGRRLTPEGASGYQFYVIETGTAAVLRHQETIATLGPGDFFGEMAMMGDGQRIADVVATSPMTIFAMFGTSFRELEANLPDVAAEIRAKMQERLLTL